MTNHLTAQTVDHVIVVANKTVLGGAAAATAGGAAVRVSWIAVHGSEIAAICSATGAIVAVVGLAVSVYFQFKRNRREEAEHRKTMGSDY